MDDQNSAGQAERSSSAISSNDFIRMAEDYHLQGNYQKAIEICRRGLQKTPDALRGRLILGKCYLDIGMILEAKQELEKVAEGIEECLSVYKLLGQVYLREKNMDQASEVMKKAIDLSPKEEKKEKGLALPEMPGQQFKKEPDILEECDRHGNAFQDDPTQQKIQTDTLAEIYIKQGHLRKALSIYQEILGRQPGNKYIQEKQEALRKQLETQRHMASNQRMILELERWLTVVTPQDPSPSS